MTHTFNPTILREYDIRGIVGGTLTEDDAYALGRTYGSLHQSPSSQRCALHSHREQRATKMLP